ncbi:MAG: hypothetical protein M3Z51_02015, partial [Snodgrassella alvi]|nr:hypothetical protein [Snodgrassella alvi]
MKLTVSARRLRQLSLVSPLALLLLSACANFGRQPELQSPQDAAQLQLPAGQTIQAKQSWWLGLNQPLL